MMKSCDYKRCIHKTEDSTEYNSQWSCDSCVYNGGNDRADFPSDWSKHKVCCHNREYYATERYHDHRNYGWTDLPEEFFKIYQRKCCQNCRNDLSLITNHIYLYKTEIPLWNICCRCA